VCPRLSGQAPLTDLGAGFVSRREQQRSQVSPKRRVAGFGLWAITTNLVFLGLLLIAALRLAPSYFEYLTVKDIVMRAVVEQPVFGETAPQLRNRLAALLVTNQVHGVEIDDIAIYPERGVIVVDARYETRFPLFWILDAVMKFDDLVIETAPVGRS
jgi:hypothetical protein